MKKIILTLFSILALTIANPVHAETSQVVIASPESYDFGDITQSEGPVSTIIEIINNSNEDIKINRLSTSCGCTTAEMSMGDLKPGETRKLTVTFDPLVHPDQFGPIIREVYLQTSDPTNPELSIEITGNVVKNEKQATIFFNEACQDCGELVKDFYPDFFSKYDYEVVQKDYINEKENRQLLNQYNEKWDIPFELQSHIETFIGSNLVVGGHVPENIISYLIEHPEKYNKILVYQDKMHGEGTYYKVWDFVGEIKTYPLDEPITTYLNHNTKESKNITPQKRFWSLFTIITGSAFLDGINPCAIAVLLFFIAFLFTIKKSKQSIWKMGLVYISAIYLAYLLIGIGLAQAIIISGSPHLMAYIGAYLVIFLGIIQILNTLIPKFPIKLRIPINTKTIIEKWLHKATIPAAFIGGFVVGLCTFPCSGGIYVAIIGMLTNSQTHNTGLAWMIWYNFIFVLPLVIILLLAGNPLATEKLQRLERKQSRLSKIVIGTTMILLGVSILLFFT